MWAVGGRCFLGGMSQILFPVCTDAGLIFSPVVRTLGSSEGIVSFCIIRQMLHRRCITRPGESGCQYIYMYVCVCVCYISIAWVISEVEVRNRPFWGLQCTSVQLYCYWKRQRWWNAVESVCVFVYLCVLCNIPGLPQRRSIFKGQQKKQKTDWRKWRNVVGFQCEYLGALILNWCRINITVKL